MIFRGPGLLAGSLSQSSCVSPVELIVTGEGEGGWARSRIKRPRGSLWSSINNSILSETDHTLGAAWNFLTFSELSQIELIFLKFKDKLGEEYNESQI